MIPAPSGGGLAARVRSDAGAAIDCARRCAPHDARGAGRRERKAADAPGPSALRFCRQNGGAGRGKACQKIQCGNRAAQGRTGGPAVRQAAPMPQRLFKICARRGFVAALIRRRGHVQAGAARGKAAGLRAPAPPLQACQYALPISAAHGLRPLRCPPPLRMCRRPAQGAAWRSGRARRTPPAACRPCPWRIADSGAARPTSPPSALPAPSRPRRAGLFAGRRAPHARPFPRPRTAGGLPGTL